MDGVGELIFVGLDGLAVDLVRPASIISDDSNGTGDIGILSPLKSLACTRVSASAGSYR